MMGSFIQAHRIQDGGPFILIELSTHQRIRYKPVAQWATSHHAPVKIYSEKIYLKLFLKTTVFCQPFVLYWNPCRCFGLHRISDVSSSSGNWK